MAETLSEDIQRVVQLVKNASFILVMAGAGMSAESGLKTYEEINRIYYSIVIIFRRGFR